MGFLNTGNGILMSDCFIRWFWAGFAADAASSKLFIFIIYNLYLLNLFLQLSKYSLVTFLTRFYIFLIMYSYYNLITSTITLLCPYIIPLQNSIINSFASLLGIYMVSLLLYSLQSGSTSYTSLIYYSYELTSPLYISNSYR